MSTPDRRAMLERDHPTLSIRGQCRLLGIARSSVYRPRPANDDADLALMRRIDALFMAWPFLGSRRMMAMLRAEGQRVNRQAGTTADAADADRRPRVEAADDEAGAGAQGLSIPLAGPGDRPAEPGVGGRHYLHPDRPRVPVSRRHHRLVLARRARLAAVEHHGHGSASTPSTRRWRASAGPTSSTPTRAASSPAPLSPAGWRAPASGSRWTTAAGWTTSSSNGCGVVEVRGRLFEGLRRRRRGTCRDRRLNRLLQRPAAASGTGRPGPDDSLA